ncbi:MAG: hydrogenase maturation nickel metallochaperone HypA [Anaerolineales bacterium]
MHELSVTQNILDIALRHAEAANAAEITDIYLVIGQLSSMVDDSVAYYWEVISQDTIAQGARLHFQRIPAQLQCTTCGTQRPLDGEDYRCPHCQGEQLQIIAGEEFYLESIDIQERHLPEGLDHA